MEPLGVGGTAARTGDSKPPDFPELLAWGPVEIDLLTSFQDAGVKLRSGILPGDAAPQGLQNEIRHKLAATRSLRARAWAGTETAVQKRWNLGLG